MMYVNMEHEGSIYKKSQVMTSLYIHANAIFDLPLWSASTPT
jgi:hypothetical protein